MTPALLAGACALAYYVVGLVFVGWNAFRGHLPPHSSDFVLALFWPAGVVIVTVEVIAPYLPDPRLWGRWLARRW